MTVTLNVNDPYEMLWVRFLQDCHPVLSRRGNTGRFDGMSIQCGVCTYIRKYRMYMAILSLYGDALSISTCSTSPVQYSVRFITINLSSPGWQLQRSHSGLLRTSPLEVGAILVTAPSKIK